MKKSRPTFQEASERLELVFGVVAGIAEGGPLESVFYLLHALQVDDERYGSVIAESLEKLAAVSDGPIKWKQGRGWSGIVRHPKAVYPHVWSSAHQMAFEISRLAREAFYCPLEGIDDADEQQALFQKLLSKTRRKAFEMTVEEIADYQERIRRERAKVLATTDPAIAKPIAASAVEALLGDDGSKVLRIARSDKSADDRAIEICTFDRRCLAWKSPKWAELLGCSDANIRKSYFWMTWRKIELKRE